MMKQSKE